MNIENLESTFMSHWDAQKDIDTYGEDFLNNLSLKDFLMAVSIRSGRSRGVDIEKRIRAKNNWTKAKKNEERGDAKAGDYYIEIKSSIVTPLKTSSITLRGFRNWEDINSFCFVIVDYRNYKSGEFPTYIFSLTKEEFEIESHKYGLAKAYNQSKKASAGNKNIPMGITMKIGDENFKRWLEKYTDHEIIL